MCPWPFKNGSGGKLAVRLLACAVKHAEATAAKGCITMAWLQPAQP
jgi:hypothetical protein